MALSPEEKAYWENFDRLQAERDKASRHFRQGLEVGELVGRIQAYQELLNQPVESRHELVPLSLHLLREQVESLKQQLLPGGNVAS
jgi:hypothetical protein